MSNNCSCNSNCKSKKSNQNDFNIKSSNEGPSKEKCPKTATNNQWA